MNECRIRRGPGLEAAENDLIDFVPNLSREVQETEGTLGAGRIASEEGIAMVLDTGR
jgi:hypothetical protein